MQNFVGSMEKTETNLFQKSLTTTEYQFDLLHCCTTLDMVRSVMQVKR